MGWLFKLFFLSAQFVISIFMMMPSGVSSARADVLERVRERGAVRCAAGWGTGFSDMNSAGRPAGFDVDFCRAVAAAVLGKADAVEIERIDTANKYQALARGEVDIVFGMATWTYSRDVAMGSRFVAPTFFDGQGFMVWSDSPITRLDQARGAKVCVQKETTTAANLRDLSRTRGLDFQVIESTPEGIRDRFIRRECDLLSADRSELAMQRATRVVISSACGSWTKSFSREPMGPNVAAGDERWFTIVRWVIQVTQIADARAVDAASQTRSTEQRTASRAPRRQGSRVRPAAGIEGRLGVLGLTLGGTLRPDFSSATWAAAARWAWSAPQSFLAERRLVHATAAKMRPRIKVLGIKGVLVLP